MGGWRWVAVAAAILGSPLTIARADSVVISNRTAGPVRFQLATSQSSAEEQELLSGDCRPFRVAGPAQVVVNGREGEQVYLLAANTAHFFAQDETGKLGLIQIGLGEEESPTPRALPAEPPPPVTVGVIRVKILVDDDEKSRPLIWEPRLTRRIKAASAVLEKHAGVKLEVVATATWTTAPELVDYEAQFEEFEKAADPSPAVLAIGFSSQFLEPDGRTELGGVRGPFRRHLLVREFPGFTSEAEKLEVLIHELGHFLGAVHSPESDSVMRPNLADRKAILKQFTIRFDPVNSLILSLVGEEWAERRLTTLRDISRPRRARLVQVYGTMAQALPGDSAAPKYRLLASDPPPADLVATSPPDKPADDVRPTPPPADAPPPGRGDTPPESARPDEAPERPGRTTDPGDRGTPEARQSDEPSGERKPASPLADATASVVAAIVEAGRENKGGPGGNPSSKVSGDRLTELYVQRAAAAAAQLPEEVRAKAFLLALGIALDDSRLLRSVPQIAEFATQVETEKQRKARVSILGKPTLRKRRDWAQHFAVSCTLVAFAGERAAEQLGLLKEVMDSQGGSGFSFADLAADYSGITLAKQVLASPEILEKLAVSFRVEDFMPQTDGLPEGLQADEFKERFGSLTDKRFDELRKDIVRRITRLEGYRSLSSEGSSAPATSSDTGERSAPALPDKKKPVTKI